MWNMEYAMRIGGECVSTEARQSVLLPYDGSEVGTVFRASAQEVDRAVCAARRAAPIMREMTLAERSAILRKAAARLAAEAEEFARTISSESGKPLKEARVEVERAVSTLEFSAEEARRLAGEVVPMEAAPAGRGRMAITVREPLGVIAAITPFNFPLNLSMHKIGPAIAAGNAVVHKPASTTPITALRMAALFEECGLPAGALNVVTGPGGEIGDLLTCHREVAMVTFTGSAEVGVRIRHQAGLKRVTLELGNNSAVIVDRDADLEAAVPRCVIGSFTNSGQVCISIQRIYVHEEIREEFLERFVEATRRLQIGHPLDPNTDISSLITERDADRIVEWIEEALQAGARLLAGGERRLRATVTPAVLADVPPHVKISCKEAFGPVVGINSFRTLEEAIARVNDSEYGLQAGIYTRDIHRAFEAARRVHVGGFLINEIPQYRVDHMPYGGVKMSGFGREGPKYAIEEMTELKLICWKL
jgi:acyl-CoA reductase-like NAD-dependent aldehyde dehydrogenase